jgi:hypothetical protein
MWVCRLVEAARGTHQGADLRGHDEEEEQEGEEEEVAMPMKAGICRHRQGREQVRSAATLCMQ